MGEWGVRVGTIVEKSEWGGGRFGIGNKSE